MSKFSRQHYVAIAKAIMAQHQAIVPPAGKSVFRDQVLKDSAFIERNVLHRLTEDLAAMFGDDNANFDRSRFYVAAGYAQ